MKISFCVFFAVTSMVWVVAEAIDAYRDGWFWPSQVMAKWGKPGINFFTHGGMWGDLILLPITFGWVLSKYGDRWSVKQIVIAGLFGLAVTAVNHVNLIFNRNTPDPLGWKGEKWSHLIGMHFVYMSVYIMLAALFFFSPGVSVEAAIVVSFVLGIHTALGTHIILGLLNHGYQCPWCPDFLNRPSVSIEITAGVWVILAGFSWYAAGVMAFIGVVGIGVGIFACIALPIILS